MKKILYLCDVPFDSVGGAQKSMGLVVDGLASDFEFKVVTPKLLINSDSGKYFEIKRWENLTLKNNGLINSFKIINEISKVIKQYKPDIIHVQMPSTMIVVVLLKLIKRITNNTIIYYTDRGVYKKYGSLTRFFIFIGVKFSIFSKIICTTENNQSYYYELKARETIYIPNSTGIEFEKKQSKKKSRSKIKNIGFSGRWSVDKNWDLAKKIIIELSKRDEYHFSLCIGVDTNHEYEVKEFFKEIKCRTNNSIELILNATTEEMVKYYQDIDLFILTSSKESFGRTAIEAMALSTVVMGTKVDGLKEVIGHDDFLYKSDDLEDFIRIFSELDNEIEMKRNLETIKQMFENHYYNNFSIKKNIELHKKLYTL